MQEIRLTIADFPVVVLLPDGMALPSNFDPFIADGSADNPVLRFDATAPIETTDPSALRLLDDHTNDLGRVQVYALPDDSSDAYLITLRNAPDRPLHCLLANSDFSRCRAEIQWGSPDAAISLSALLRIAFSQAIIPHDAFAIHASAVVRLDRAHLFLGASGTGKSTHARLWLQTIPRTTLLNDDCPILRLPLPSLNPDSLPSLNPDSLPSLNPDSLPSLNPDSLPSLNPDSLPSLNPDSLPRPGLNTVCGSSSSSNPQLLAPPSSLPTIYGSPWSGKTPCYRQASAPLATITRLRQAPANRLRPLSDIEALTALLPSCMILRRSHELHSRLIATLSALLSSPNSPKIRLLECLPNPAAARLSAGT